MKKDKKIVSLGEAIDGLFSAEFKYVRFPAHNAEDEEVPLYEEIRRAGDGTLELYHPIYETTEKFVPSNKMSHEKFLAFIPPNRQSMGDVTITYAEFIAESGYVERKTVIENCSINELISARSRIELSLEKEIPSEILSIVAVDGDKIRVIKGEVEIEIKGEAE